MSKTKKIVVPASLIAEVGTGEDTHGVIGKRVRLVRDTADGIPDVVRMLFNLPSIPVGTEATAIHVSENDEVWADFGDNEDVPLTGPEGERARIYGLGPVGGDEHKEGMFEIVE